VQVPQSQDRRFALENDGSVAKIRENTMRKTRPKPMIQRQQQWRERNERQRSICVVDETCQKRIGMKRRSNDGKRHMKKRESEIKYKIMSMIFVARSEEYVMSMRGCVMVFER
jgi:hypothetical protein